MLSSIFIDRPRLSIVISLVSRSPAPSDQRYDTLFLSNYATINVLGRVNGEAPPADRPMRRRQLSAWHAGAVDVVGKRCRRRCHGAADGGAGLTNPSALSSFKNALAILPLVGCRQGAPRFGHGFPRQVVGYRRDIIQLGVKNDEEGLLKLAMSSCRPA